MTVYTCNVDITSVRGIDVHTHVNASVTAPRQPTERMAAMAEHFRTSQLPSGTVPDLAETYRELGLAAVTFTIDPWARTGEDPTPSIEELCEQAALHSDVIIPFSSVHPGRGPAGRRLAERHITELGVRGFKFHPNTQAFYPNDHMAYPLYEVLQEHRVPALFHTGQSGAGAGTRGGSGIRLKYSNPLHLDDVAADFPDLTIVLAHPSFPWQEEAIAVAMHKPNVYIDLSGWSPKYFPPILVQYANTLLKDRVLFGSDYPLITPQRWLTDLEKTEIRDAVKPGILKDNAARMLGIARPGGTDPN